MSDDEQYGDFPEEEKKVKKEKPKKARKPLTQAQKDALAKGRATRDKNREKNKVKKTKKKEEAKNSTVIKHEEESDSSDDEFVIKQKKTKQKGKSKHVDEEDTSELKALRSDVANLTKILNKKSKPVTQTVVQVGHTPTTTKADPQSEAQERMLRQYLKF